MKLDVGHAVAVARGGRGSTLRLEHRSCNRADGHKLAREIARENRISASTSSANDNDDRERERRARIDQREHERRARQQRRVIITGDEAGR